MKRSAGILAFRRNGNNIEVLLLHLAGPIWVHKDNWHFPKGEVEADEDDLVAAHREFEEEMGIPMPPGELIDLGEAKMPGKMNRIWALQADVDLSKIPATLTTNVFTMEWPPRSGNKQSFPENDRAEWFALEKAYPKVFKYLTIFLDRLASHLDVHVTAETGPDQQSLL